MGTIRQMPKTRRPIATDAVNAYMLEHDIRYAPNGMVIFPWGVKLDRRFENEITARAQLVKAEWEAAGRPAIAQDIAPHFGFTGTAFDESTAA